MFDIDKLPKIISDKIAGLSWTCDTFGKSGSTVLIFDDMVLKIEKIYRSSENELAILRWIDCKLPVPRIIESAHQDGYSFILMSKMSGEMACSDNNLQNMEETIKALATALKMLWQVDITECPFRNDIPEKLIQAKYQIENGLVDTDDLEEDTLSKEGFLDLWDLYNFLCNNKPTQDLVFSHGDFCLPNIFISNGDVSGLIDWGNGGIADRWQDIALCDRSLRHTYSKYGLYSETEYQKYKKILFNELEIEPDEEKMRYYCLLDELF